MRIVYGLEVAEKNDKYISLVEKGVDVFIRITVPGRYLVEALPFLRHLPSWFPGAKFQRQAREWRKAAEAMCQQPVEDVKQAMVCPFSSHCVASHA